MSKAVSLTSIGLCSALGVGLQDHMKALNSGDVSCMSEDHEMIPNTSCVLGKVDDSLLCTLDESAWYNTRFYRLVATALFQIEDEIQLLKERYTADRIGVVIGSSTSGIDAGEDAYLYRTREGTFPSWYAYPQQEMGSVARYVRELIQVEGPAYTISTACTSGAKALLAARRLIQGGVCDAVVTGGADSLCRLTVRGFHSLGLVAPGHTNPMSKDRQGLNLGEGACLFTMERGCSGVVVRGGGESSDAHHMSAPHPEGKGAIAALQRCLQDGDCLPEQVGYVNLHGTGTIHNDRAEAIAIHTILGCDVPCSSTKPLVGHLLGAAGAFEAGVAYGLLMSNDEQPLLPPHVWDGSPDPELPHLNLVTSGERLYTTRILSTSFAFGGSNCALLFERSNEES